MAKMPQRPWQQSIAYDSCLPDRPFLLQCLSFLTVVRLQHIAHLNFTERRNVNLFWSKLLWKLLFKGFVLKEACLLIPVCRKKTPEIALYVIFLLSPGNTARFIPSGVWLHSLQNSIQRCQNKSVMLMKPWKWNPFKHFLLDYPPLIAVLKP